METKANYIATGVFTLAVIVGAFGFIFWFQNTGRSTAQATYRVVFDGSVSGLRTGAAVLFNGIPVGEVAELSLDAADPHKVVAVITLGRTVPVRADTKVGLQFQGLTGLAEVSLAGGSVDAAPLAADPLCRCQRHRRRDAAGARRARPHRRHGRRERKRAASVATQYRDRDLDAGRQLGAPRQGDGGPAKPRRRRRRQRPDRPRRRFDPPPRRRSRQEHQRHLSRAVAVLQFGAEGISGLRHRWPPHLGRAEQGDQEYRPAPESADFWALVA